MKTFLLTLMAFFFTGLTMLTLAAFLLTVETDPTDTTSAVLSFAFMSVFAGMAFFFIWELKPKYTTSPLAYTHSYYADSIDEENVAESLQEDYETYYNN